VRSKGAEVITGMSLPQLGLSLRLGFALVLGAMGIAILTGADKRLKARVLSWLPDTWVNLTVGI